MMKAKSRRRKRTITIVSVLVAVIIASALIIPNIINAKSNDNLVSATGETKTETVATQDIRQTISGSGEIVTGDEEILVTDEDEEIDELLVAEGQAVKKGDALLSYTDDTEMTAPFNGVISKVPDYSGDAAKKSGSDSITIMSTENLVTELSVDETDLKNIKIGQSAEITVNAFTDTKYTGKIVKISETGEYDNGSSKFKIQIKLDKTTGVKIGMSAAVEIVVKSVKGAVAVPIEAVKGSGDNASVIVVNSDGTVVPTTVTLGLANDAYVQIVKGLSAGDVIQYTIQSKTNLSGSFGGFGTGGMLGQGGNMTGRNGNGTGTGTGTRIPGGNMPNIGK